MLDYICTGKLVFGYGEIDICNLPYIVDAIIKRM
jgi:hypothetical protein